MRAFLTAAFSSRRLPPTSDLKKEKESLLDFSRAEDFHHLLSTFIFTEQLLRERAVNDGFRRRGIKHAGDPFQIAALCFKALLSAFAERKACVLITSDLLALE